MATSYTSSSTSTLSTQTLEITGDAILQEHCTGFKTHSYLLPPLMDSLYTEERTPTRNMIPKPSLTNSERRQFIGMVANQGGETAEYHAFCYLHQLSKGNLSHPFIVLKSVDWYNSDKKNVKESQLQGELPSINLSSVRTDGEHDFIMIVRNVGVILIEVKSSLAGNNIPSAEVQLENGKMLMYAVMGGVRGSRTSVVPVEKMILLPNEATPSPTVSIHSCHRLHNDLLDSFPTFKARFDSILQRLKAPCGSSFTAKDFDRFTKILVGFWCLTPMLSGFTCNRTLASTVAQTEEVNRKVKEQEISSFHMQSQSKKGKSKWKRPVTDVEYYSPTEIPRSCKDIGVLFLTPQQKDVLDNYPRVIVTGSAGTGKTLLTFFSCISILQNNINEKILLIVPPPHHVRCEKILQLNKIAVKTINSFPPDDITGSSVFIIELENFFKVSTTELLAYSLEIFHVFLDDAQSYEGDGNDNIAIFDDIAEWIECHYNTALQYNKHFWCCIDVLQGMSLDVNDSECPMRLLFDNTGTQRPFTIPTVKLSKILRNSSDIITTVMKMRDVRISESAKKKLLQPHTQLGTVSSGHHITGAPVLYHKLKQHTDAPQLEPFVLQMVATELDILLDKQLSLKPCDIAILYDDPLQSLTPLLRQMYGVGVQTIRESIMNCNNNDVIMDVWSNSMSYETTCVLYIRTYGSNMNCQMYVLTSRARARLTIIDGAVKEPPSTTEHVTLVTWEENHGTFVRN